MQRRNIYIDITKGILVIGMVLYHSINYYSKDLSMLKYISFITGSFIFISGFIISNIYFRKYDIKNSLIYQRLISRGIKLILIFSLLNVIVNLMLDVNYGGRSLGLNILRENIYSIYINGNYKIAAFEILLPISYLLLIIAVSIYLFKNKLWIIHFITLILLVYCSVKYTDRQSAYNLRFIAIGFCGVSFGFVQGNTLKILYKYKHYIWTLCLLYYIYVSTYKLFYPIYLMGVIINLAAIYTLSNVFKLDNIFKRNIILLGRYTLIAYIIQILILQLLSRMDIIAVQAGQLFIAFAITTILTTLAVNILDYYLYRSSKLDKMYRAIFA